MFGKPSPKKSGNGISGYYKGEYYRSLLELSYAIYLEKNNIAYESGECKKHRIAYAFNGGNRTYFPDFYIPVKNEYHEVKPSHMIHLLQNVAKMNGAIAENKKIVYISELDIDRLTKSELCELIEIGDFVIDPSKQHFIDNHKGK